MGHAKRSGVTPQANMTAQVSDFSDILLGRPEDTFRYIVRKPPTADQVADGGESRYPDGIAFCQNMAGFVVQIRPVLDAVNLCCDGVFYRFCSVAVGHDGKAQIVGGGNEIMLNRYLEQLDTSLDELAAQGADVQYISASEGYTAIKDGNVNTCNYQAAIPLSSLVEALASLKMNFISLDQATAEKVADIYGYSYDYIPAGSYQYQDSDVGTLCDTVILVINSDVDDAVAYNMAKALAENKDALVSAHASFEAMDAQVMAQCGIDLHPGAQAYYESAGLL